MLKFIRRWWNRLNADPDALIVKREPLPPARIPRKAGAFSTDITAEDRRLPDEGWGQFFARQNIKSFQRTIKDFVVVSAAVAQDGAVQLEAVPHAEMAVEAFAMDGIGGGSGNIDNFYSIAGGAPVPQNLISWYASQGFIGYQMCGILLQHWFIDKACTMPARDAVRNGWDITRHDGEKMPPPMTQEFQKWEKTFAIKSNCVEAVRKLRGFGVRVILFEVNSPDPDYYVKPFNPDGIQPGSYRGMSQVDPYWVTPELDFNAAANPASKWFYEPTYWRINGKRYHRTHLIVLKTCEVADVLKPSYYFGGIPLPQRLYERVYAAERTANEAPQLAMTKRLNVIEGVDMAAAAANPQGVQQRIREIAAYRDNYGVLISGGTESHKQLDTSLTEMDALIMTQYEIACAIVEVPVTKMMGGQPTGLGATGEYDESSYHEMLESVQEHDVKPIIDRHTLLTMRSYICPKFGCQPFETGVSFADLDAETAKEHAERTNQEAERDLKWAQSGAIDGTDIRNRLISDKNSGYSGIEEAEPAGPAPRTVVQPNAPSTAPNTAPGQLPTPAPEASTSTAQPPQGERPAASSGTGHDALDACMVELFRTLVALDGRF